MNQQIKDKKVSDLTSEELKELMAWREKQDQEEKKRQRQYYEEERDRLVDGMVREALELNARMATFKQRVITKLEEFRKLAKQYGDIRSNSKGGFSLRRSDGEMMVVYERNVKSYYDERADLARDLIMEFLRDMVKKHDKNAYEFIIDLMQKNVKGDFNPVMIAKLVKHEDRYSDERWKKAIGLFKEAYQQNEISMSVSFYEKDAQSKDQHISLSLPSIPIEEEKKGGSDVQG